MRTPMRIALPILAALLSSQPLGAQWRIEASAIGGRAEHRVNAGFGVGSAVGTVAGGMVRVRVAPSVDVSLTALGGSLSADGVAGDDRTLGELGSRASVQVLPWLALETNALIRSYESSLATQRWTQLGLGAEARLDFAGGLVRSVFRTSVLPHVAVSGMAGPEFGLASAVGLRVERNRWVGTLEYAAERFVFASEPLTGSRRREQISSLLLGAGRRW